MANYPIAGASVRLAYGFETTYGSVSSSIDKAFSQGVKLSTFEIDNSVDYIYGLGSQDSTASVCKEFKGTWGVEFPLSDPWWLTLVLGADPTDAGSTPYTHTWDSSQGISNTLTSGSLDIGFDLDTDSHQILLGCVANTMSLTCNVGEIVRVKLDGTFANMTADSTLISLVSPVEEPFSFAAGTFELPNSTTIGDVQSLEISFNRNVDLIWGLGSRFSTANVPKQREWNIRLTATFENANQFWNSLMGGSSAPVASPAEVATARLTISNGLTSSDMRKYVFTFANVRVERGSLPASVEDVTKQDITLRARTLTSVVVSNDTAVQP